MPYSAPQPTTTTFMTTPKNISTTTSIMQKTTASTDTTLTPQLTTPTHDQNKSQLKATSPEFTPQTLNTSNISKNGKRKKNKKEKVKISNPPLQTQTTSKKASPESTSTLTPIIVTTPTTSTTNTPTITPNPSSKVQIMTTKPQTQQNSSTLMPQQTTSTQIVTTSQQQSYLMTPIKTTRFPKNTIKISNPSQLFNLYTIQQPLDPQSQKSLKSSPISKPSPTKPKTATNWPIKSPQVIQFEEDMEADYEYDEFEKWFDKIGHKLEGSEAKLYNDWKIDKPELLSRPINEYDMDFDNFRSDDENESGNDFSYDSDEQETQMQQMFTTQEIIRKKKFKGTKYEQDKQQMTIEVQSQLFGSTIILILFFIQYTKPDVVVTSLRSCVKIISLL